MALVVFGSAITSATPGDIDVAYTDAFGPQEEEIVREWAAERGLPVELPIDTHPVHNHWIAGEVYLPVPCDLPLRAEVIDGEATPKPQRYRELSSVIRAYGHDANRLIKELTKLVGGYVRFAIRPRGDGDFDDYVEGLKALRSAVAKAPAWQEAWPNIPFGQVFNRLVCEDPRPGGGILGRGEATIAFSRKKVRGWRAFMATLGLRVEPVRYWARTISGDIVNAKELEEFLWPSR